MHQRIQIGVFVAAATLITTVACGNYLSERPSFVTPCVRADPSFNRCYTNNFQSFLRKWKDGVPGLKSLGPLDPFHVKRISIVQDQPNSIIQLNGNLQNIKIHGAGSAILQDVTFDWKKLTVVMKFLVPKVHIDSDYSGSGIIFNLPLDASGHLQMNIDNTEYIVAMRLKLRDEYGFTFTDVAKSRLEITNVGGFQIHMENLFNGQKNLEDSTHALINQNWRTLYDVIRDPITDAMRTVMSNWLSKVFAYVPASFLITDLPTAAEYSG